MPYIKWFILTFVGFAMVSLIFGVAEMQVLGPYSDQAVFRPFFDTFKQISSGDYGKAATIFINPDTYDSIFQMLTWNYAVLQTGIGLWVRIPLFALSGAFLFAFSLTLYQSIPFIGRGS